MPQIVWRPVFGLPASAAQDGYTVLPTGALTIAVRPVRPIRHPRQKRILSVVVGDIIMQQPAMRDCKAQAERIVHKLARQQC